MSPDPKHGYEENRFGTILTKLNAFLRQNMLLIFKERVLTIFLHVRLAARLICTKVDAYFIRTPKNLGMTKAYRFN